MTCVGQLQELTKPGHVTIQLDRPFYQPGDKIRGTVQLTLSKKKRSAIEGVEVATTPKRAFEFYKKFGFEQFKDDFREQLPVFEVNKWERAKKTKRLNTVIS